MERAAVVGLGTMGTGIAQVLLQSGFSVVGIEPDEKRREAGKQKILAGMMKSLEKGKLTQDAFNSARDKLRVDGDVAAGCKAADLVVEAIVEDLAAKQDTFHQAESSAAPDALLASNTSSLSISAMATLLKDPARFVGLHFFNPVPLMALVEIVRGEKTSAATIDAARRLVTRIGKEAIVVKDSPGFASSRLGVMLGLEATRMLEEGVASAEDIDKAMELGYRHPMGPLKLGDLVGLDVRLAIAEHLEKTVGPQFKPPQLLKTMVKEGRLGKKTGQGFYTYPKD